MPVHARALFREIIDSGEVAFSGHAYREMEKDDLSETECKNIVRAGVVEPPEWEQGAWRYRIRGGRGPVYVVCELRSNTSLVIVTAWRVKK